MKPRPLRHVAMLTDGLLAIMLRVAPPRMFVDPPANDNSFGPVAA